MKYWIESYTVYPKGWPSCLQDRSCKYRIVCMGEDGKTHYAGDKSIYNDLSESRAKELCSVLNRAFPEFR